MCAALLLAVHVLSFVMLVDAQYSDPCGDFETGRGQSGASSHGHHDMMGRGGAVGGARRGSGSWHCLAVRVFGFVYELIGVSFTTGARGGAPGGVPAAPPAPPGRPTMPPRMPAPPVPS